MIPGESVPPSQPLAQGQWDTLAVSGTRGAFAEDRSGSGGGASHVFASLKRLALRGGKANRHARRPVRPKL